MGNSRRDFLKKGINLTALLALSSGGFKDLSIHSSVDKMQEELGVSGPDWPILEGPNTPKLVMGSSSNPDQYAEFRRIKQLGVNHVTIGGGEIPWVEEDLRLILDRFDSADINIANLHMSGFNNVIYGRDGADEQIEYVQESLRAAGTVGIPVVEYNWYVDRLIEGYYYVEGRGGAGYTGFDYSKVKDLPPDPDIGIHTAEELWNRLTYFLEAVIPVAEEAGVKMALHPNDPPVPKSRGSDQIVATFDDWKRLLAIVDSPYNGMTCHPGYYKEMGEETLEVIRYLGERDRINHVHYRSVSVVEPVNKYIEVFPDNGNVNMFEAMRELVRQGYTGGIYPEHSIALDYDRNQPNGITHRFGNVGRGGYGGMIFNVAYARAMLQAALIVEGKV